MATPHIAQKSPIPVEVEAGKDYWWCACGQSKTQPFCDGSHKGSGIHANEVDGRCNRTQILLRLQADQEQPALRRHPQGAVTTHSSISSPSPLWGGRGWGAAESRSQPSPTRTPPHKGEGLFDRPSRVTTRIRAANPRAVPECPDA